MNMMLKREKSMKTVSPLESARNGYDTLVQMDRTDTDNLNVPSPKGSFQRTQSFIKQILSMKADLNTLFPTEPKDNFHATPLKNSSTSMASSASTSDIQCSSSRNYGIYRKKNSRSVKLAPLTPSEGSCFSSNCNSFSQQDHMNLLVSPSSCTSSFSSSDVTPVSSIRFRNNAVCVVENHSNVQSSLSPADHARLWQEMLLHSPVQANSSQKPVRGAKKTLHFDELSNSSSSINDNDELITDNCSIQAVQSEDDYHSSHYYQHHNKKYRTKPIHKSLSLDNDAQFNCFATPKAILPQIYSCDSADTVCMPYEGENHPPLHQNMQSWSHSTDVYDDFSYQTIRTKSFNGEGLSLTDEEPISSNKNTIAHLASNNASMKILVSLHNDEDDLIPTDPDEDDHTASNHLCEVEMFLDAYCSGKEKQYASAMEALSSNQQQGAHINKFADDLDEELEVPVITKKSIKNRKSTGIPKKKLSLTVASLDDSDVYNDDCEEDIDGSIDNYYNDENDFAYHY